MEIIHDKESKRFYINTDEKTVDLSYQEMEEKLWNFLEEDEEVDCCGVIDELNEFALKYVQENEIKILANCCSIQNFISKNPTYSQVLYKAS